MQSTTARPSGKVSTSRKTTTATTTNNHSAKNQNKKKKSQQPKNHGNGKEGPADSRSMASSFGSGSSETTISVTSNVPPPGFAPSPPKTTATGFSDAQVRLLRHRALFAFRYLIGKAVELQLVASEERYAGILDCVDPDEFSIVLKNAKRLGTGAAVKPFVEGSTVIFRRYQLAHLVADGAVNYKDGMFASGASTFLRRFRTDTEISERKDDHLFGRELETASSWLDPALDTGALEDSTPNGKCHSKIQSKAGWNQFEANEKLFGVVSTYDENIYTTKLDKSKISSEQSRTAEKLAQEIESQSASGNFHLQEERGQTRRGGKQMNDLDEEARYSSVDRKTSASFGENTYVPPALRKAYRQCGTDKLQAKTTKTLSASAPTTILPPAGSHSTSATTPAAIAPTATAPAVTAPTATAVSTATASPAVTAPTATTSTAVKPLSFSEAVTGRSAVAATSETTPKVASEIQLENVKGAATPQTATTDVRVNGKDTSKLSGASSTKTDLLSGKEKRIDSKVDSKLSSSSSSTTATNRTTATTKLVQSETPKTAPKKGLNLNTKEFKLSASAAEFTPSFAVPLVVNTLSPYHGGSPDHMPYPQPGMGYPPPMQEEWMYDGAMGGVDSSEMGMPPYMQGGYVVPMGSNGVPMMYPPMTPQQNMHMMGGQRGNYDVYQQQGYNPRGYHSPRNAGHLGSGLPYTGDLGMLGGVGPQPPLPPTPNGNKFPSAFFADVTPAPAVSEVESAPASLKQLTSSVKKK